MSRSRSWLGRREHLGDVVASPTSAAPISLLRVERLARAMQRRGGLLAAIGLVGVPATMIMQMTPGAGAWGPGAILWTIVACVGLRGFFVAREVLAQLERPGAPVTAVVDGRTLILCGADEETHVGVSAAAIRRLRRHAVPTSIARSIARTT